MAEEKTTEIKIKNPYTQIAYLAVQRKWCWNIYCPFCHHIAFRYAILDLVNDITPESEASQIERWPASREHYVQKYGRIQSEGLPGWTPLAEGKLASILMDIDIGEYIENISFPECVYILGLGLHYIERAEASNHKVGKALATQMLNKLNIEGEGRAFLEKRASGEEMLSWRDVEMLETAFQSAVGATHIQQAGNFRFSFKSTVTGFFGRHNRRHLIAEMLDKYSKEKVGPELYGYLFTADEIIILAKVHNSYTFSNSLMAHVSNAVLNNLAQKESSRVADYVGKRGLWLDPKMTRYEDDADIAKQRQALENIPVEKEYVAAAGDWLWSSACKEPLVNISLAKAPGGK